MAPRLRLLVRLVIATLAALARSDGSCFDEQPVSFMQLLAPYPCPRPLCFCGFDPAGNKCVTTLETYDTIFQHPWVQYPNGSVIYSGPALDECKAKYEYLYPTKAQVEVCYNESFGAGDANVTLAPFPGSTVQLFPSVGNHFFGGEEIQGVGLVRVFLTLRDGTDCVAFTLPPMGPSDGICGASNLPGDVYCETKKV
eukprot:TRINITY_DN98865_c0_g1_i1.p1 TRINITY_DN98865_c0_g1~~TRINITY_DN98865_c0_g1_i1.p1  ORF type:complete len:197 (+),score=33.32 TRINITY_DN98865_c0_g1_i1:34-624(+)